MAYIVKPNWFEKNSNKSDNYALWLQEGGSHPSRNPSRKPSRKGKNIIFNYEESSNPEGNLQRRRSGTRLRKNTQYLEQKAPDVEQKDPDPIISEESLNKTLAELTKPENIEVMIDLHNETRRKKRRESWDIRRVEKFLKQFNAIPDENTDFSMRSLLSTLDGCGTDSMPLEKRCLILMKKESEYFNGMERGVEAKYSRLKNGED